MKWSESHSIVSDSLWPHELYSSWTSPGLNTGVGSLSLLQGIFPTQGLNPGLLHYRWILYQLSHKGSPRILEWVAYPFFSGSSPPRNWTRVCCIASRFFTNWTIREAPKKVIFTGNFRSNLYRMTQWSLFLFTCLRCLMNAAEFTSSLQRMNKKILFFLRWTGSSHKESSMTDINMVGFPGGFLSQQSKTFCWFQPHLAKTSHINNSDNYGEINCYFILIL